MEIKVSLYLTVIVLFAIIKESFQVENLNHRQSYSTQQAIFYSPAVLRELRPAATRGVFVDKIPPEIRPRKRGRKGGVRARFRRRFSRPPLPAIITGNVRSLNNKLDELATHCRYSNSYREAGLVCLSETWLAEKVNDSVVKIDNFAVYRCDRNADDSGKLAGGGVCAYVNDRWCSPNNTHVTHRVCTPDFELLGLSLRPIYLPREFPKINLNVVYIPPSANEKNASEEITNIINEQQEKSPDSVLLVTGDFNHHTLDIPNLYQYINCPTREANTIDLCYGNVKDCYRSTALAPLGSSDHNMVQLLPKYRSVLKQGKPERKSISIWDENNTEKLQACFECTNWDVFTDSCTDLNELNDTIKDYILFCEEMCIEKKTRTFYSNSKPWISKDLKEELRVKQRAFQSGEKEALVKSVKKVKTIVLKSKKIYKEKLEQNIKDNPRAAWDSLKLMSGYKRADVKLDLNERGKDYVDNLNKFYARFDVHDFKDDTNMKIKDMLEDVREVDNCTVSEKDVECEFKHVNARKACGPDGVTGKLLKTCSKQLSGIFTLIFNISLSEHILPLSWKTSEIVPVPKKPCVKELNDLRPVALTSIVCKCLERIVLKEIKKCCKVCQDQMQFAYREKRGVDDALLVFTDNILRHLDTPKSYCRILFVDFSSAFNTIQPHILISKLINFGINKNVIAWVMDFLKARPQYVRLRNGNLNITSGTLFTNTGAPQGAVLSPFLFTIYTNDCQIKDDKNLCLIKFADDTSIQGMIRNDDTFYRESIASFVKWCEDHYLLLNVKKTKELIIDFRKKKSITQPLFINNEEVEIVQSYKYLGVTIDDKLNWNLHADNLLKNINKRLYFLQKLNSFRVDPTFLRLFYQSVVQSVITFAITCWGGNTQESKITKINSRIRRGNKLMRKTEEEIQDFMFLYMLNCQRKVICVSKEEKHPLFSQIKYSCRSGRPLTIKCKSERYRKSFMPSAVKLL